MPAQNATGLAPGVYEAGKDGLFHPATNINMVALWPSVWKENTNGLRVLAQFLRERDEPMLRIGVGSVVSNDLGSYVGAPYGKFRMFELRDSNNIVMPLRSEASHETNLPFRISIKELPRWPHGGLKNTIGFFTNGRPYILNDIKFQDLYRITNEGDYTLNVCAAIYKFESNIEYLDRIDLPCVVQKIHLMPSPKKR
jgi:hypothetical protein